MCRTRDDYGFASWSLRFELSSNFGFVFSYFTETSSVYILNATQYSTPNCTDIGVTNADSDLVTISECGSPTDIVGTGVVAELPALAPGFKELP